MKNEHRFNIWENTGSMRRAGDVYDLDESLMQVIQAMMVRENIDRASTDNSSVYWRCDISCH